MKRQHVFLIACVLLGPSSFAAAGRPPPPLQLPRPPAHAAAARQSPQPPLHSGHAHRSLLTGRRLKQLTFYASTPALATRTTAVVNGRGRVGPDGTLHGSAGVAATTATGLSNRLLQLATLGGYPSRPEASTSAYVDSPLILESTLKPTQAAGLGEARGDLLSTALAGWAAGEIGFNPLSGNLGASATTGTANSLNLLQAEELVPGSGLLDPGSYGLAGVEFSSTADDQTRLGDARTAQLGDAIAYPFNVANPINPLQCTQVLTYGLALARYDPTASPGGPLPPGSPLAAADKGHGKGGSGVGRQDGSSKGVAGGGNSTDDGSGGGPPRGPIPFCLDLFNLASLDEYADFLDRNGSANGDSSKAPETAKPLATAQPLPANQTVASANRTGGLPTFEQELARAVAKASPEARKFLTTTPAGQALLDQIQTSPIIRSLDNATRDAATLAGGAAAKLSGPLRNLSEAVNEFGAAVARGAANFGLKAGTEAARAAAPLLAVRANASRELGAAVSGAGSRLAARSFDSLMSQVAALSDPRERAEVERLLASRVEAAATSGAVQQGAGRAGLENRAPVAGGG